MVYSFFCRRCAPTQVSPLWDGARYISIMTKCCLDCFILRLILKSTHDLHSKFDAENSDGLRHWRFQCGLRTLRSILALVAVRRMGGDDSRFRQQRQGESLGGRSGGCMARGGAPAPEPSAAPSLIRLRKRCFWVCASPGGGGSAGHCARSLHQSLHLETIPS